LARWPFFRDAYRENAGFEMRRKRSVNAGSSLIGSVNAVFPPFSMFGMGRNWAPVNSFCGILPPEASVWTKQA